MKNKWWITNHGWSLLSPNFLGLKKLFPNGLLKMAFFNGGMILTKLTSTALRIMGSQVTRCLEIQKTLRKTDPNPSFLEGPSWFLGWDDPPPSRVDPAMSHWIFSLLKNGTRRPSAVMWRRPALWAYGGRKRIRSQCRGPRILGGDKVSNEKRALFRVYIPWEPTFFFDF